MFCKKKYTSGQEKLPVDAQRETAKYIQQLFFASKKKRALPLEIRNLEFFLPTPIIKLLPYTSPLKKVADPVSGLHKHSLCCGASTGLPMKAMSKQWLQKYHTDDLIATHIWVILLIGWHKFPMRSACIMTIRGFQDYGKEIGLACPSASGECS